MLYVSLLCHLWNEGNDIACHLFRRVIRIKRDNSCERILYTLIIRPRLLPSKSGPRIPKRIWVGKVTGEGALPEGAQNSKDINEKRLQNTFPRNSSVIKFLVFFFKQKFFWKNNTVNISLSLFKVKRFIWRSLSFYFCGEGFYLYIIF